jgi:Flp pilus assembly protein TadD
LPKLGWGADGAAMTGSNRSKRCDSLRCFAPVALAAGLALTLLGCTTTQPTEPTGALGTAAAAGGGADGRRSADAWGERYRANPGDPDAAIHYARALRKNGQRPQAVAVLEQAAIQNPKHRGVLDAFGRALADDGHYTQAVDVLDRAQAPGQPDWRILSVQGAALDQMGRHEEAQRYYGTALRLAPDEPSVLSNLGLSYALSKDLVRAETTLRRAAGQPHVDPRVRKNLALVVGLQGRWPEADGIAGSGLPPDEGTPPVAHLRQMLALQNGWKQSEVAVKPLVRAEGS